jgi:hypothetical protein
MLRTLQRARRHRRAAILSSVASVAFISTAASADCTADSTGLIVTCTGASTGYSNVSAGVSLSTDSTATVTGPVLLGNNATATNAGSMTSASTAPILQVGSNSSIVNNGTIQLTNAASGSPAVLMGDDGTLTNNASLSATAGTPVIEFGQNGTFINNSSATAAVTGNISYGPNVSGGTSTLRNYNTAFGIAGNIYSVGSTSIYNDGLINGLFVQTPTGSNVTLTNDTAGIFTGSISTGDTTSIVNSGTLSLNGASTVGSARLGISNFTNSGTLNVGTTTGSTELVVNGAFVNSPSAVLNLTLHSNGASAPVAGTTYSQIYAAGSGGTATLGGTLNIVPTAGFYPSGSTYNLILADQSISGGFTSVNGNTLPFISFVPVGITMIGTQQAYEVMAVRSTTYADAIGSVATPSQLAIARGLQPLVGTANADPTTTAATLVGDVDLLTVPQTQTLLDQINPGGYLAFGQALTDQMNLFNRQVQLRSLDEKNDEMRSGWWGEGGGQLHIGKTPADGSSESIFDAAGGFDVSGTHWRAGAALGFSTASIRSAVGPKGHNDAFIFGGYGAFHAGPITATAQVDYDLGSFSATKNLSLAYTTTTTAATSTTAASTTTTPTNIPVTASSGDHLLKASGTLGVDLVTANFKITPFAGIDYARGSINGFTESGGDAADLTVARLNLDRTDLLGGLNVTTDQGQFRPYVRAAYRSEIGSNHGSTVAAYFDGDPSTAFTVDGTTAGRHEVDVDAGLNVVYEDGSMFVGYQGTIRKDMSDHGIQAGVRFLF